VWLNRNKRCEKVFSISEERSRDGKLDAGHYNTFHPLMRKPRFVALANSRPIVKELSLLQSFRVAVSLIACPSLTPAFTRSAKTAVDVDYIWSRWASAVAPIRRM
jgi:hypothetical protein